MCVYSQIESALWERGDVIRASYAGSQPLGFCQCTLSSSLCPQSTGLRNLSHCLTGFSFLQLSVIYLHITVLGSSGATSLTTFPSSSREVLHFLEACRVFSKKLCVISRTTARPKPTSHDFSFL